MSWWQPGPHWRWPRQHLSKVDCSPIPSGAPTKDREDSQLRDCWSILFSFEIIILEEQLTGTVKRFRRFDTISGPTLRERKVRNKSQVLFTRTKALILAMKVDLPWRQGHVVTQGYFIGIIAVLPFCLSVMCSAQGNFFCLRQHENPVRTFEARWKSKTFSFTLLDMPAQLLILNIQFIWKSLYQLVHPDLKLKMSVHDRYESIWFERFSQQL